MIRKWKSVLDDRTCGACELIHGMVIWAGKPRPPLHERHPCVHHGAYEDECRCVLEPANVLAVGERFNYHKWWRPCKVEMEYSLTLRLNIGFYNRRTPGSRRTFLDSLGVEWTDGINLLWPSPIVGYWNKQEAKKVVKELRLEIEHRWDAVLLFGKRVCEAFEIEYAPLKRQGKYVPMPHPSGCVGRGTTVNFCAK